jgi:hypothetical protein
VRNRDSPHTKRVQHPPAAAAAEACAAAPQAGHHLLPAQPIKLSHGLVIGGARELQALEGARGEVLWSVWGYSGGDCKDRGLVGGWGHRDETSAGPQPAQVMMHACCWMVLAENLFRVLIKVTCICTMLSACEKTRPAISPYSRSGWWRCPPSKPGPPCRRRALHPPLWHTPPGTPDDPGCGRQWSLFCAAPRCPTGGPPTCLCAGACQVGEGE